MQTARHSDQTGREVHRPTAAEYDTLVERDADIDWLERDIGKIVRVGPSGGSATIYELTAVDPIVWTPWALVSSPGDLVGPNGGVVAGELPVFSDITGKLQGGSGILASQIMRLAAPMELDLDVDVSTATAFQDKVTLTTPALPLGDRVLFVAYNWNNDTTGQDFRAQLLVGGAIVAPVGWEHRQEGKEVGGTNFAGTGTDQKMPGIFVIPLPATSGVLDIALQWATSSAGQEASIWNAVLALFEVG